MWGDIVLDFLIITMASQAIEILVVSNFGISEYDTETAERRKVMIDNEMMIKEVDYHYPRNEVYGLTRRQIVVCPLKINSSYQYRPVVYSEDEYNFMSMAVDWVHGSLYWTGGASFMIHKAWLNGSNHHIIFRGYYIETFHKKLLVDPNAGLLFWATASQIFSADLDGKNVKEIRFPEILGNVKSRVKNLAVDVTRQRLYFLAGFEDDDVWLMMSGNYDGSGFRRHDSVNRFTYAMAAMGDNVYWIAKEMGPTTYAPGGFTKFHSLVLYKGSTLVLGSYKRIMDLKTGAVWNMKICHPDFQMLRSDTSLSSKPEVHPASAHT